MPPLIKTDVECPKCGTEMFIRENQQSKNVYGCEDCGIVWMVIGGRLLPALESERKEWLEYLNNERNT